MKKRAAETIEACNPGQAPGGYCYLERRVPARILMRDPRELVKFSIEVRITDDPRGIGARRAAAELDAKLLRSRFFAPVAPVVAAAGGHAGM